MRENNSDRERQILLYDLTHMQNLKKPKSERNREYTIVIARGCGYVGEMGRGWSEGTNFQLLDK